MRRVRSIVMADVGVLPVCLAAGDGVFTLFHRNGHQPDHALLAVQAAAALQELRADVRREHPDWPGLRGGVNSGRVVVSEMGGRGYVAFRGGA